MANASFDPRPHLRRLELDGQRVEYLDVKWRIIWLRQEHPEAQITTEHIALEPERAVFRATVVVPGGGSASGYGTASTVEAAETAALGRALLALGYGTAYAADYLLPGALDMAGDVPTPAPAAPAPAAGPAPPRPSAPAGLPPGVSVGPGGGRTLPPKLAAIFAQAQPIVDDDLAEAEDDAPTSVASDAVETPPAPPSETPEPPPARALREPAPAARRLEADAGPPATSMPSVRRATPPTRSVPGGVDEERATALPERQRPAPAPSSRAAAAPSDEADESAGDALAAAADNDWSAFWPWARARGYYNRDDIEKAIGQPIRGRTPREVRTLLMNLDDA